MSSKTADDLVHDASAWWSTGIIDVHPGEIKIRGYPIEELIGELRFPEMIWLMLRGEVPRPQATLLEAALVAAVDHGPHAPSIAISRMAVTCSLPINGAMASAVNALDDIHGGAGQRCMGSTGRSLRELDKGNVMSDVVDAAGPLTRDHGKAFPVSAIGSIDRSSTGKLLELVDAACAGHIRTYAGIGVAVEESLERRKASAYREQHDGATADLCRLACPARAGLFSRALGRHSCPRLGANRAGRENQGTHAQKYPLQLYRRAHASPGIEDVANDLSIIASTAPRPVDRPQLTQQERV
jgi:citrate synthase